VGRALRDRAFIGGLWLNTLPALFFGTLDVLVPLLFDDAGYGALAIAAVFVTAGAVEVVVNPVVGRISDRRGRLLPVRVALAASIAVAIAFALATEPRVVAVLVVAASVTFGGFYTPGMALVSDRADRAKAICRSCPVITECLDHALRVRESYGVWGGHTEDERARLLGGPVPALSSADPHYRTPRRVPPPRPSRNQ
jgi:hypothetical protein